MEILKNSITKEYLRQIAPDFFTEMVKAVVDIDKGVMAINAELHADLEKLLLNNGSEQSSLWGINLYQDADNKDFIEYDSLINIRPRQKNFSRYITDTALQEAIAKVVNKFIK